MHAPKMRAACLAAFASATLLAVASPAFAGEKNAMIATATQPARSIAVNYADLDLREDAGVERLNRRVRSAAKNVCDVYGLKPVAEVLRSNKCYGAAMERAERDIQIAVMQQRGGDRLASSGATRAISVSRP